MTGLGCCFRKMLCRWRQVDALLDFKHPGLKRRDAGLQSEAAGVLLQQAGLHGLGKAVDCPKDFRLAVADGFGEAAFERGKVAFRGGWSTLSGCYSWNAVE